jgi:uncharacterized caspase-like protein
VAVALILFLLVPAGKAAESENRGVSTPTAPSTAQRVALVIGNSAYVAVPQLPNPVGDARAIAAALLRLGFDVELVTDADRTMMEAAIRRLGDRARGADAVVFFYAGHALQAVGRNFLLPVSAAIREERDLRFETIDFEDVLTQGSNGARIAIYFLDSCRDNPFRKLLTGAIGARSTGGSSGMAPTSAATGTLIAFATDPGNVAEDGRGAHSPFATALLEHLETPGLEIRQLMSLVRRSVRNATRGRQAPWESASLEGDFYFRPKPLPTNPSPNIADSDSTAADRLFWETIKNATDPAELEAYLARFPEGIFAALARTRLKRLQSSAPPVPAAPRPVPSAPPVPAPSIAPGPTVPLAAREVFDPEKVPFVTSRVDVRRYQAYTKNKALAISTSGVTFWSTIQRRALAGCEFYAREPCFLYAVDNWVEPTPDGRRLPQLALGPGAAYLGPDAGGRFDPMKVPFVNDEVRMRLSTYLSARDLKALAVSPHGNFAIATGAANAAEAQRVALEHCLAAERNDAGIVGKKLPCYLYAAGDIVVLARRATAPLAARQSFDPETVPVVGDRTSPRIYKSKWENKAFAISPSGKHYWWYHFELTRNEAQRHALEGCEFDAREPCYLYATNEEIEPASGGKYIVRPSLPADGPFDAARVPFANDETRERMKAYSGLTGWKAVAVSPHGKVHWSVGSSAADAQAKTLAQCRAENDKPCYVYAVGNTVVLSRRATTPLPASTP